MPADPPPPTKGGKRKIDELARAIEKSKRKLKGTEVRDGEEGERAGRAGAFFSPVTSRSAPRTHTPHHTRTHRKSCAM